MATASAVNWPEKFLPGTTDNYVSNEVVTAGLTAADVWPLLADVTRWASYYDNASQVEPPASGPVLQEGDTFSFTTFGHRWNSVEVAEAVKPTTGTPGRLAWRGRLAGDGSPSAALEVYHAWLVEDLPWGAVRIVTQESQIGGPAVHLAAATPNPVLNGHQSWLTGLVRYAKEQTK